MRATCQKCGSTSLKRTRLDLVERSNPPVIVDYWHLRCSDCQNFIETTYTDIVEENRNLRKRRLSREELALLEQGINRRVIDTEYYKFTAKKVQLCG